jgi:hypothetical protein
VRAHSARGRLFATVRTVAFEIRGAWARVFTALPLVTDSASHALGGHKVYPEYSSTLLFEVRLIDFQIVWDDRFCDEEANSAIRRPAFETLASSYALFNESRGY